MARPLLKPLTKPTPTSQTVYIISGLGGHVLQFRPLANALSSEWDVTGILYPVFAGGAKSSTSVAAMADEMRVALDAVEDPIVLIGYSLGGAIAYQIATELSAMGKKVAVVPIDTRIRTLRRKRGRVYRGFRNLFYRIPRRFIAPLRHSSSNTPQGSLRGQWRPKEQHLREFVDDSIIAMRSYRPARSDVPVILIRAGAYHNWHHWIDDQFWPTPSHGWSNVAPVVQIVEGPGDHYTITDKHNIPALAQSLDKAITVALTHLEQGPAR